MAYLEDANHLIDFSKETFDKIKQRYSESLSEKNIKPALLIEIKNFMENLRSSLDFVACGLFEKYGDGSAKRKIYFPYAPGSVDQATFQSKKFTENCIPGITNSRPDIAVTIEGYQHFANKANSWLPQFMELNNKNKHQQLTPQERREVKELRITSGNTGIVLRGNAGIRLTGNAFIRIGNSIIPGNQVITPTHPAITNAKQEVITWVSFHFASNGLPVLKLLEQSLNGVGKIVNELSEM